jgi:predicted dithiol-disulfide oxidoreductase (DUF899 family)
MEYREGAEKLAHCRQQITELRKRMRELQQSVEPQKVGDYEFAATEGPARLAQLFGGKEYLFVIHNMGASCSYCTLWADGFNGILQHIENKAAFVVSTPDEPGKQDKFKASRGWRFRMVSHMNTTFAADMGYRTENGWLPGVSVFRRQGGNIVRVSDTAFGPCDDFCSIWHLLDLLPEGADGWHPKFSYE